VLGNQIVDCAWLPSSALQLVVLYTQHSLNAARIIMWICVCEYNWTRICAVHPGQDKLSKFSKAAYMYAHLALWAHNIRISSRSIELTEERPKDDPKEDYNM